MTNFPNGVSSQGIPLVPGVPLSTGTYFFVSSVVGSDGNTGRDKAHPLATLQAAVNKCTAGKADVILLMPGHAETVTATNIALNVEGVQIYGLGSGLKRPTFTYGAAAATITVSAANCGVHNCHHIANFLSVAAAYTIGAAKDFWLDSNTFLDTSSILDFLSIVVTGSTANAADGLTVTNNWYQSLPTTANAFVSVLGNLDRLLVTDNYVDKAATNDAGQFITVAALVIKGARILRNTLNVVGSAAAAVGVFMTGSSTTNTGVVANNFVVSLDTTGALLLTATLNLGLFENYYSGAIATSGALWPVADNPA